MKPSDFWLIQFTVLLVPNTELELRVSHLDVCIWNEHCKPKCHQKSQNCFLPIGLLPVQNSFVLQGGIMTLICVKLYYLSLWRDRVSALITRQILWKGSLGSHRNCQTEVPSSPIHPSLQYIYFWSPRNPAVDSHGISYVHLKMYFWWDVNF